MKESQAALIAFLGPVEKPIPLPSDPERDEKKDLYRAKFLAHRLVELDEQESGEYR